MLAFASSYQNSLKQALGERSVEVYAYRELDSTNTEAKRLAAKGARGPLIIAAEQQTAGRGRLGRSFFSPRDTGVYFSILYTQSAMPQSAVSVTSAAAVAVMEAIMELTGVQCGIKWVNDLYYNEKKVCGILCESVMGEYGLQLIVGIGINLSTREFPSELDKKAGALGVSVDRCTLIAAIWRGLEPFLRDPARRDWLDSYRAHSLVLGKQLKWVDGDRRGMGTATAIDADGGLIVRRSDGTECRLCSGEISVFVSDLNCSY